MAGAAGIGAIAGALMTIPDKITDTQNQNAAIRALAMLKDPHYNEYIAPEYNESLARSKTLASSTLLPGQANLEQSQDQILADAISGINSNASDAGMGLGALLKVYGQRQKAQNDIGYAAAQSKMQREQMVLSQLNNLGDVRQSEHRNAWNINELQPFLRHYDNIMSTLAGYSKAQAANDASIKTGVMGVADLDTDKAKKRPPEEESTSDNGGSSSNPLSGYGDYDGSIENAYDYE